jgi:hypothetical protein
MARANSQSLTQPVKEKGVGSAVEAQETKHVGKVCRPGSYLRPWAVETGVAPAWTYRSAWDEQEERFFCFCFYALFPDETPRLQHPELTLTRQQKFVLDW